MADADGSRRHGSGLSGGRASPPALVAPERLTDLSAAESLLGTREEPSSRAGCYVVGRLSMQAIPAFQAQPRRVDRVTACARRARRVADSGGDPALLAALDHP